MTSPRFAFLGGVISPFELLGLATMALVCGIAFWRGGSTERRIAAVVAIAWVASILLDDDASTGVQWRIFAIDLILGIWLIAETLFSGRIWPAFAAGAQIFIVLTHVAFMVKVEIVQDMFYSAYYLWSYVVLAALATGSLLSPSRPRRSSSRDARPDADPDLGPDQG